MIKLLHSGDWHLDSPLVQLSPEQARVLRRAQEAVPEKLAAACRQEGCDLVLLSGDLFDGVYTRDTLSRVKNALEEMSVPVFISPGNHDYADGNSPYFEGVWPSNVHIFKKPVVEAVSLPELACTVYGAGYTAMDCPGLLRDFVPAHNTRYALGVLHGDPTRLDSPYCPVTEQQVEKSKLDYLALGHIHKAGSFQKGKTLCLWPGCPVGRGYDETGEKGYYIVTVDNGVSARFVGLGLPRFYDLSIPGDAPLSSVLPPVGNEDFYRITLTGPAEKPDLPALQAQYAAFPNLELRDRTVPPTDLWGSAVEDTFEGIYFKRLRQAIEEADPEGRRQLLLAAKLSRQLLDGQEVVLP